jgi:hypothetical protein
MRKLLWIAAVTALGAMSFGQGRGGMMMMGGGLGSGMRLAARDDVAKELNLTADQKVKIQDAMESMRGQRGGPGGPGGGGGDTPPSMDDMKKRMADRMEQEKKALADILNADQLKRLRELGIQRAGNSAILDPSVQSDLKFTDEQKKKVDDLMQKQMEAGQAIGEKLRNQEMTFEEARPLFEKNQKIMSDELGKILTADQAKQLADMGGKAFTFDASLDQQGFGRRGGGGGGGGF